MTQLITLAHGNGGRLMRELLDELIVPRFKGLLLDSHADAVALDALPAGERLVVTTDGYTVQPLEFPGGNIGSLAVHGTVNDLAVTGATPHYLCLNMIIEEGLERVILERVIDAFAEAARQCNVKIAAGDTKVVPRGEGSGLYLATTGIGSRKASINFDARNIKDGDVILVSGPVGDHGTTVMLARQAFGLSGDLVSDSASVLPLCKALLSIEGLRFMRDPTRGGLATVMHELHSLSGLGVLLDEAAIPLREPVKGVCEILGYDPLYLACEGRVVAIVSADQADQALKLWQAQEAGRDARIIGSFCADLEHVVLKTSIGGERLLFELEDDPLPRIC